MNRTTITAASAAAVALSPLATAGPAAAAGHLANSRPAVEQTGSGTWVAGESGAGFRGTTTGRPISGSSRAFVMTRDGSLPTTPHTCEEGSGTLSTWSDKATLTLTLTGDICLEDWPVGDITLLARYDVASYAGSRIKPGATG